MKIAGFVSPHLCLRGTTTALYDYACANEDICGNLSVIFYNPTHPANSPEIIEKFRVRFTLVEYRHFSEIERKIPELGIDYLYVIKYGTKNLEVSALVPTLVHSVFVYDPHGIYACVSKSIADKHGGKWLPHIVNPLPKGRDDFRQKHGIPAHAYLYGRYGGADTFSIDYLREIIRTEIDLHPDFYFAFVNTNKFIEHPRVLFLPPLTTPEEKGSFVSGCDAMIHGRLEGETFGLAIAEFCLAGKPVVTCPAITTEDNEHLRFLTGSTSPIEDTSFGIVYRNREECSRKLWTRHPPCSRDNNPYSQFNPESVMKIFWELLGVKDFPDGSKDVPLLGSALPQSNSAPASSNHQPGTSGKSHP